MRQVFRPAFKMSRPAAPGSPPRVVLRGGAGRRGKNDAAPSEAEPNRAVFLGVWGGASLELDYTPARMVFKACVVSSTINGRPRAAGKLDVNSPERHLISSERQLESNILRIREAGCCRHGRRNSVATVSNNNVNPGVTDAAKTPRRDRRTSHPEPSSDQVAAEAAAIYPDTFDTPPTPEEIAAEAYAIYQARGGEHGRDQDDWLEAERRLSERRRRSG
jgi:Protein of unknown function (DUF2934)